MKLAFTTLGCPAWDLDTLLARAREYGYDGVDFRGYQGRLALPELPEFSTHAADTAARLRDAGLEVPCLSTGARVAGDPAAALAEVSAYLPLCPLFGASYLRLFGGGSPAEVGRDTATAAAVDTLRRLLPLAADHGVTLLLETHDEWLASAHTRRIMEEVDSPQVGMLWDVHHPYRYLGEAPDYTWSLLGPWIRYTHFKDSRPTPGMAPGYQLCLTGEGDLPFAAILGTLRAGGYDGYLTLEWEKVWHPDLEEPEVAFPGYLTYIRQLLAASKG